MKKNHTEHVEKKSKNSLKEHYARCIGLKKELLDAVKRNRELAEQGDSEAQYFIGVCYKFGDGVAKNKAETEKWFLRAADQGHENAKSELKKLT